MIRRLSIALVAAIAYGPAAHAHATLQASVPADGSTVAAPTTLTLTFSSAVRLTAVRLQPEAGGATVQVRNLPKTVAQQHAVPAPALKPGRYELEWRSAAADGHVMSGKVKFTVVATPRT